MKIKTPRLIAVTGKGGVGKSIYSIAETLKYAENYDVSYLSFEHQQPPISLAKNLIIDLKITDSTSEYIGRKLGSKVVANWVTNAKFFNALYGMLPGLSHMIMLGHILDILEKNPQKRIILDCPATGHFLSILNIPSQFKSIFKIGAIVKDIDRMINLMSDPSFFQIKILSLPSMLSIQEAYETKEAIMQLGISKPRLILNNTFSQTLQNSNNLPNYFIKKIKQEKEIMNENHFEEIIPHIIANNPLSLINKMKDYI